MQLLKKKSKGFTLVELVVVILVIAILATATFLGGATVIKQSRKSKVQTNLSNYAAYVQDMLYAEPGVVNKEASDAETLLNNKYLTKDFQLGETKDSWNKPYEFYFVTDTVNAHKCTYVIISSNGSNGTKESYDLLTSLIKNDHVSAQAALDSNTLMTGDDLGLVVLLRDGAVSSANYGFEKASAAPTAITMLDGVNQIYNNTTEHLVFRSSAPMNTFVEVKVDDATVEPANYEVTSGSTIITFADTYAKSLANGDHTVEIVSTGGSASTQFKIEITQEPGLYVTGSKTQFAKITLNGSQVDATWENIKAAYPNAFTTANTIKGDESTYKSYLTSLSGDLVISNNITTIENRAFQNCTELTSVTIPGSVTSIGNKIFMYCERLIEINVSTSNINYSSQNGILFNKNKTQLIYYPTGKIENNYTVPNSVILIGEWAFMNCTSLTLITIPNSVTTIDNGVFNGCTSLTSISIPNSVTSISKSAFHGCTSLTSITIPNSVTSIGDNAFFGCSKLTLITIPDSVTSIGESAFQDCISLKSITIPNSVTSIGGSAFSGCSGLISIIIPNGIKIIGINTFFRCTSLTSITIPNSVTSIGGYVFHSCAKLTSIIFNGTTTQWNVITKGDYWNYNVPTNCVVHCTNGDVTI